MTANVYVVTRAPLNAGNMAMTTIFMEDSGEEDPNWAPLNKVKSVHELIEEARGQGATEPELNELRQLAMAARAPVFAVGEILYLDENGREVIGDGRKPDKWDVDVQYVGATHEPGTLGAAIALSKRVTEELAQAGYDPDVLEAIKSIKEQA